MPAANDNAAPQRGGTSVVPALTLEAARMEDGHAANAAMSELVSAIVGYSIWEEREAANDYRKPPDASRRALR